jgi:hypothetical protein
VSEETIRWPTNLDRAAIEERLVGVRNAARGAGLGELVALLEGAEMKPAAQLAAAVIGALGWLDGKGHDALEKQLQMVALNLKNLK